MGTSMLIFTRLIMQSIQEIIENHILGEIFSEFPTNLDNAFEFFLRADVDCTEGVNESSLSTEWGYEVCQAYELDNIRAIRGLMSSMYNDLEKLKSALFQYAVKPVMVSIDDFSDSNEFYEFVQKTNAKYHRPGAEELATVFTVSEEAVS